MDDEKKPAFALMFGGPKASKPSMGGEGEPDEGEGMGGARKQAVKAIAKALGSESADLASLESALQAFVESCGYEK